MTEEEYKKEFNDVPVEYCSTCLSLAIKEVEGEAYCDKCGHTNIDSSHIEHWEKLYIMKYGEKFIKDYRNGRRIKR